MTSVRIAVLGLQGAFVEHVSMLNGLPGVEAFVVRNVVDLESPFDGIVLPGCHKLSLPF